MKIKEHGYILLMTLMLMAVASLALVQVSRASLLEALAAKSAQQALQRRWGATSCQSAFLPQAELILKKIEEQTGEPTTNTRVIVTLAGQTFELLISDEQAKANVQTLYQQRGLQTTESNIRNLIRQSTGAVTVRLKPLKNTSISDTPDTLSLPTLGSFAQIFTNAPASQIMGTDEQLPAAGTYFTCWGNGKLNFRRATSQALKQMCETIITDNQIDQLIAARQDTSFGETEEILNQLALTKRKRDQLAELFTEASACHSLWVVVRDGNRSWHSLAISDSATDNEATNQIYTFAW